MHKCLYRDDVLLLVTVYIHVVSPTIDIINTYGPTWPHRELCRALTELCGDRLLNMFAVPCHITSGADLNRLTHIRVQYMYKERTLSADCPSNC